MSPSEVRVLSNAQARRTALAAQGFGRPRPTPLASQSGTANPPAAASQLNTLLNEVARTRSDRLWLGSNYIEAISWFGLAFPAGTRFRGGPNL